MGMPVPDVDLEQRLMKERGGFNYSEREMFPNEFSDPHPKGRVYDKKPFRLILEANKPYYFCTCGQSRNQVRK